jgi:hypothetical protein
VIRGKCHSPVPAKEHLPEFIDEVQDQTDDNAYDDAGSQGKIKRYIIFFDQDVSGKLSHKGQPWEDQNDEAGQNQDRPDYNHDLCYLAHDDIPDLDKPENLFVGATLCGCPDSGGHAGPPLQSKIKDYGRLTVLWQNVFH